MLKTPFGAVLLRQHVLYYSSSGDQNVGVRDKAKDNMRWIIQNERYFHMDKIVMQSLSTIKILTVLSPPKGIIELMEKHFARLFWDSIIEKRQLSVKLLD